MSSTGIHLTTPLAEAGRSPRNGAKAINLARLIAARFAVPRGFVVGADAYRSHLWACGAREAASTAVEAEDRERVRSAIHAGDIPGDVWQSVSQAYERLSWQTGVSQPRVAVRPSSLETGPNGSDFPGAYEVCLNVVGLEALKLALKRVWASLWGGKAAGYRARFQSTAEPAMAVIVQEMAPTDSLGTALTADPVTGDPYAVRVSSICRIEEQNLEVDAGRCVVDLRDFRVAERTPGSGTALEDHLALLIAEQAVLVEEVIGGRVEIDWAHDGRKLWILQAAPLTGLPTYFPTNAAHPQSSTYHPEPSTCHPEPVEGCPAWRRVTERPICHLCRSLLSNDAPASTRLVNGFAYTRTEADGNPANLRVLKEWRSHAKQTLDTRCRAALAPPAGGADHDELLRRACTAAANVTDAAGWLDRVYRAGAGSMQALAHLLKTRTEDASLYHRLLGGILPGAALRDARILELGERFAIAEQSGKLDDEDWWRGYKNDVDALVRDYAYAFTAEGEIHDVASWRSWIEDSEIVFRMVQATSLQDRGPTLVTRHCAAVQMATEAAHDFEKIARGRAGRELRDALALVREWVPAVDEAQQVHALACTGLRLRCLELGRGLADAGAIPEPDDVFQLALNEIPLLPRDPVAARESVAAAIARRKHDLWLEGRLAAPDMLPIGSEPEEGGRATLRGVGASPGVVTGRARVARTAADAGEIEPGDILIVRCAGPGWTPFLAVAGGLVSELPSGRLGEPLLALDYGVPVVTGCPGIVNCAAGGWTVTVDGDTGLVEVARHRGAPAKPGTITS